MFWWWCYWQKPNIFSFNFLFTSSKPLAPFPFDGFNINSPLNAMCIVIYFLSPSTYTILSPLQFLLIVPLGLYAKRHPTWPPYFLPMSSTAYCFICILRQLYCSFESKITRVFSNWKMLEFYVLIIKVVVGVVNCKNDCKVFLNYLRKLVFILGLSY